MSASCPGQLLYTRQRESSLPFSARADAVHTVWDFCPSTPAAILFTILFALTTSAHFSQAIIYKKTYCWMIFGSGLAQTLNYTFRMISIAHPDSLGFYTAWFVLILIAPLFTNAFVYMVMGRMVWNYIPDARIYRITAWRFSTYFVILDIIALIVQVAGASSSAGSTHPNQRVLNAIHVYMGGVGLQQLFILVFSLFAINFHRTISRRVRKGVEGASNALPLLYAIYTVLILLTTRIIFRLCEYAQGFQSTIPTHEAYQYCLDSAPMLCALIIFNFLHPGRIMSGKESDLPSRKDRKSGCIYKRPTNVDRVSSLVV